MRRMHRPDAGPGFSACLSIEGSPYFFDFRPFRESWRSTGASPRFSAFDFHVPRVKRAGPSTFQTHQPSCKYSSESKTSPSAGPVARVGGRYLRFP